MLQALLSTHYMSESGDMLLRGLVEAAPTWVLQTITASVLLLELVIPFLLLSNR